MTLRGAISWSELIGVLGELGSWRNSGPDYEDLVVNPELTVVHILGVNLDQLEALESEITTDLKTLREMLR